MPELEWPVLSSYLQQPGTEQGTCFPQYSVRNNRFHFIEYTSNNDGWESECNASAAWKEEELYEIGTYRDKDPNEWNNLIRESYYRPVRDYLAQWLPEGNMYFKRTYKSKITSNITDCLVSREAVIEVNVTLTDSNGAVSDIPEGYGEVGPAQPLLIRFTVRPPNFTSKVLPTHPLKKLVYIFS